MTPNERSSLARQVLDNPVLDEAVAEIRSRLITSWETSHPDHWKDREALFNQLTALNDLRNQLETFIHTAALDSTAKVKHGRTERYNARND